MQQIISKHLDPRELVFDSKIALKFLKMPADAARAEPVREQLFALHSRICDRFQPCFQYRILTVEKVRAPSIVVLENEIAAFYGKAIYRRLRGSQAAALFCATVGDQFAETVDTEDARFEAIFADAVASTMVQATFKILSHTIENELENRNLKLMPRLSPGYPGWDLSEQVKLLDLLQPAAIGVRLSKTYFMTPQKSLSGVFGIVQK